MNGLTVLHLHTWILARWEPEPIDVDGTKHAAAAHLDKPLQVFDV
jgi:hypothetical protein